MMKTVVAQETFRSLVEMIRREIQEGTRLIERQKTQTYWKVGRHISRFLSAETNRAPRNQKLFQKLSENLNISARTLYRTVRFYEAYPSLPALANIEWGHYQILSTVKDENKRAQFQQRIEKQNLTTKELQLALKTERDREKMQTQKIQKPVLPFERGALFTYRAIEPQTVPFDIGTTVVDCGFNIWRKVAAQGREDFKDKDIVCAVKSGQSLSLERGVQDESQLYTFKAVIERIVDADTLWLHIDCGFDTWTRQKVRLRGIDAPELDSPEGQQALRFVTMTLKDTPTVVVKTHKAGKYGRYLADIFYIPAIQNAALIVQKGRFLNQELLDANLAQLV